MADLNLPPDHLNGYGMSSFCLYFYSLPSYISYLGRITVALFDTL